MRTKLSPCLALAFLAMVNPLLAFAQQAQQPAGTQQPPWDWPGPWHMWGGGWGFWWVFPLCMLLMIAICVAIFLVAHRSAGSHHHWAPWQMMYGAHGHGRSWGDPTYSALQILNERFAKGEIQKQEYEEKRAVILASGQH